MSSRFENLLSEIAGASNVLTDEPMSLHTSFRIGGPADHFVTPGNVSDLCGVIELCRKFDKNYFVLGNGSNILVSDKGYRGVVIQIQKNICNVSVDGEYIYAESGALLSKISSEAVRCGLSGFEFASGIPGTLGGAVVMNAGAYGGELKDVLVKADVFKPSEGIVEMSNEELKLGYRTSIIKHRDWIVLGALLKLQKGDKEAVRAKIEKLKEERNAKQPLDYPSAGSAFKRPQGDFAGRLVMEAGLRGYSVGDAAVSEKHCGFLINKGNATASDMKKLFNEVIRIVREKKNVTLEPEVRFIGEFEE